MSSMRTPKKNCSHWAYLTLGLAVAAVSTASYGQTFKESAQALKREMISGGARVTAVLGDDSTKIDTAIYIASGLHQGFTLEKLQSEDESLLPKVKILHWYSYQGFVGPDSETIDPFLTDLQKAQSKSDPLKYQQLVENLKIQMRENPIAFAEQYILNHQENGYQKPITIVFHDYLRSIQDPQNGKPNNIKTDAMRDFAEKLRTKNSKAFVILKEESTVAVEGRLGIEAIKFPLPSKADISQLIDGIIEKAKETYQNISLADSDRAPLIDALDGLTEGRIQNILLSTLAKSKGVFDLAYIKERKRLIIQSEGVLDIFEPSDEEIGGYDTLQEEILEEGAVLKRGALAKEFGAELSKGILLLGVPGVGKSLTVKAASRILNLKVIKLDGSKLLDKFVGGSEEKTANLLKMITRMQPAILWIDEIEKLFAGLEGGSSSDSGTSQRVFQQLLTWLNDQEGIYVMATANNIQNLPPELLDRFETKYALLPPNLKDRKAIAAIQLKKKLKYRENTYSKMPPEMRDQMASAIAQLTSGYTGRNLEQAFRAAFKKHFQKLSKLSILMESGTSISFDRVAKLILGEEISSQIESAAASRSAGYTENWALQKEATLAQQEADQAQAEANQAQADAEKANSELANAQAEDLEAKTSVAAAKESTAHDKKIHAEEKIKIAEEKAALVDQGLLRAAPTREYMRELQAIAGNLYPTIVEVYRVLRKSEVYQQKDADALAYKLLGDVTSEDVIREIKKKGRYIDSYRDKMISLAKFIIDHEVKLAAEPDEDTKKLMEQIKGENMNAQIQRSIGDCNDNFDLPGKHEIKSLSDLAQLLGIEGD